MAVNFELKPYLAVKRIGSVIAASEYLTWVEAEAALKKLTALPASDSTLGAGDKYSVALECGFADVVQEVFHGKTSTWNPRVSVPRDSSRYEPSRDRGFVYRSKMISFELMPEIIFTALPV